MTAPSMMHAHSRKAGLDLLRTPLLTSLAPSQAHTLRGFLNGVVLAGELARLASAGHCDDAALMAAGESLRSSIARFREAFERFLNHLVMPNPADTSCETDRAMRDAAALIGPLALERRIAVEIASCPPGLPRRLLPGAFVTVLAFAALEVLEDVADGGCLLLEATMASPGTHITISGRPSRIQATPSRTLSLALETAVAAFGGLKSSSAGCKYTFELQESAC